MSFWKIAWRNMEQRALASTLTGLSMALGVAVMISVIVINNVAVRQFSQDAQGYHLIVGGKGGSLQLVLSTVYHLGQPLYPIPYSYYKKFVDGEFAELTELAIPCCLGDSYVAPNGKTFRVVATTPDLFDKIQYATDVHGNPQHYAFRQGRNFEAEHFFEAVLGSVVAAQSGLKVGDHFAPTHGVGGEGHEHDEFEIVGILEPTGTANDRAVFINIEGFYLLEGHALTEPEHDEAEEAAAEPAHEGEEEAEHEHEHADHDHEHSHHEPLPDDQREVTSILVLCKDYGELVLNNAINKGEDRIAQAVSPTREITLLLERIVGPMHLVLLVLTVLIVIVASIGILVSIYNSMSERSHDIAVMRALGASRTAVMLIVLFESVLLSLCGGLAGIALGHALMGLAGPYVENQTGITLSVFQFDWQELVLIPGLVILASLVGLLPAMTAYRTDVAKALSSGN